MATAKRKTQRKKAPAKKRASAKSKRRAKRGGNVITVDFTDVESGGGMPTPDGYYTAEIKAISEEVGGDSGEPYLAVRWKTHIGSTVFDNFSLQPQSLWVLRTMLECVGYEIPDSEYDLDVDALEGAECGLEILNEDYEEKERPRVGGYMLVATAEQYIGDAPEAEEEEPEEEPEEEEEEEEPEEEEEEEEEEAPPTKKEKAAAKKKTAAKKKAPTKKKKKSKALRPGARVVFEGEDEEEVQGVIEYVEEGVATVVDDEEGEWEIPVDELTKA